MTITCPSCEASFRIDLRALGPGRTVRCARCRTEWFAAGEPAASQAFDEPSDDGAEPVYDQPEIIRGLEEAAEIDAIDFRDAAAPDPAYDAVVLADPEARLEQRRRAARPAAPRAGRTRPRAIKAAIRRFVSVRPVAIAAAVAIAFCGVFVGERVSLVRAAPSLASLYDTIGMPVNVRGLSIGALRSVEQIEEGVPLLLVTGEIENVSSIALDVPRLRLAVMGGDKSELYAWTTVAARAKLAPGETAPFRARLASPPADGSGIAVRFVASRDLVASASR